MFQHQGQQDVIYDGISVEDEVLSPLFSETKVLDWLRSDGLPLDEQQHSSSPETTQIGQHPIHPIHHNSQIEGFYSNVYDSDVSNIGDWIQ